MQADHIVPSHFIRQTSLIPKSLDFEAKVIFSLLLFKFTPHYYFIILRQMRHAHNNSIIIMAGTETLACRAIMPRCLSILIPAEHVNKVGVVRGRDLCGSLLVIWTIC